MSKINQLVTTNPEHLVYKSGVLDISILGGIKLEGLDRMRATLKIQVEHLALRHNLDLYNDSQVEKLIRRVAEKLEVGTSVTAGVLNDLINELEQYRLEEIEKQQQEEITTYTLTKAEIKQAELYLKAPNLIERTKEDIGKSGVVGEEMNRLLMYLIFTSRKREQPLHIVSLGASGTGKTHLQEKVGELIPEEDKLEITSLSENAFYYFGQRQLQNKLILIEDLDGAEGVLYPLRELQSKKKISKTVVHKNSKGETRSINLTVEGPVSVAGCTTREKIYEDNANRSFLIYLNESAEQDKCVMDYQRRISAGKVDFEEEENIKEQFKNMQRILRPVKIINPYAEQLEIPEEVFKPRRTNNHYLQFIEAVTFYHQYQREEKATEDGELYIETTLEDIEEANKLMKEVLLRKSDELSGACRKFFERLKKYLKAEKKIKFYGKEVRTFLRINAKTLSRYLQELYESNHLQIVGGNRYKNGYEYEIVSVDEYQKLQESIENALDSVLTTLVPQRTSVVEVRHATKRKSKV